MTKAAERRFMLPFLDALYRRTSGEPLHLIFDEADLWAPKRLLDKEGDAAKLLGMMETIVRRGRVKGFIPWLISQRPAVLSKNVLSQVDGLVALKLTSSQDRDALGAWIEGQADLAEWKRIKARLPQLQRGEAVVWIPGRGILKEAAFPLKDTYDSSRAPRRGEQRRVAELRSLNLGALKERLASVEAETKANDPKALRAQIAELKRQISVGAGEVVANPQAEERAFNFGRKEGFENGYVQGYGVGWRDCRVLFAEAIQSLDSAYRKAEMEPFVGSVQAPEDGCRYAIPRDQPQIMRPAMREAVAVRSLPRSVADGAGGSIDLDLSRPQQRILDALAWLEGVGVEKGDRPRVAMLADVSHKSSGFEKNVAFLKNHKQYLTYPTEGELQLTSAGRARAQSSDGPLHTGDIHRAIEKKLSRPQWKLLKALIDVYPRCLDRETLGKRVEASHNSSGFEKNVSTLRALGFVDYPERGTVVALPVLFLE
jgi:hypothetical protein